MTKSDETRLLNLSRKQGSETLSAPELRELQRLIAKQVFEKKHPTQRRRDTRDGGKLRG